MNEQKNNGRGIFYGVIGVATLVVAIIGATFAYFTATASDNNTITGNMATVSFGLDVHKVTKADEDKGGMIPMSNSMVEAALSGKSDQTRTDQDKNSNICVDDNGNAVCQIYKISVTNSGTAGMFLDGYVTLSGGSNTTGAAPADTRTDMWTSITDDASKTTMRWAQVFCTGTDNQLTSCTTAGKTTTGATGTGAGFSENWTTISRLGTDEGNTEDDPKGFNRPQILTSGVTAAGTIAGNQYNVINTNYIRISDHAADATGYKQDTDVTSALVFNQQITPMTADGPRTIVAGDDSSETYGDAQVYYIVVWLTETGHNQTAGADNVTTGSETADTPALNFFSGKVNFVSAQGSEVTATFSSYTAVTPDTQTTTNPAG